MKAEKNVENQCYKKNNLEKSLMWKVFLPTIQFIPAIFSYCINLYIGTCIFIFVCIERYVQFDMDIHAYTCTYIISITYSFGIIYTYIFYKY